MTIRFVNKLATLTLFVIAASMTLAAGQASLATTAQFRVLHYMNSYDQPAGMTEGAPGVFYSRSGSAYQAALSITTQGSMTVLAKFPYEYYIQALLVSAANSRFYSAVRLGTNPANVFSVTLVPGSKQVYPPQSLTPVLAQNLPDGMLLATATSASSFYLATCDLKGTVTPIYAFPSTELLANNAMYANDGNYYGISRVRLDGSGYVYRVTPSGALTKVLNFPSSTFNDLTSWVPVLQASDGNLYGATPGGGANGTGSVYKLTLGGQYILLYSFPSGPDYNPAALIEGSDGNLYGATLGAAGSSLLFRVTKSGQYTLLHTMNLYTDGQCQCQLTQGSDGMIYGSAQVGGVTGGGTYFALDAGLPKPPPRARHFHPQSGPVGTRVLVWGYDLLSASVQVNGVNAATVSNSGPNYVWATVPAGATTGPITITTPGGSVTTKASFTVQ